MSFLFHTSGSVGASGEQSPEATQPGTLVPRTLGTLAGPVCRLLAGIGVLAFTELSVAMFSSLGGKGVARPRSGQ